MREEDASILWREQWQEDHFIGMAQLFTDTACPERTNEATSSGTEASNTNET